MALSYLVLAGPQAAGKSTAQKAIARAATITPLEEARQIVVHRHRLKGAIFMNKHHELEVINIDMHRMTRIMDTPRGERGFLDETNVFTMGHALAHGIDLVEGHYRQYMDMLKRLDARILFIDVPPWLSWERRKPRYEERLIGFAEEARQARLSEYRGYLDRLYPQLVSIYERLELPKIRVDGSRPLCETEAAVLDAVRALGHCT